MFKMKRRTAAAAALLLAVLTGCGAKTDSGDSIADAEQTTLTETTTATQTETTTHTETTTLPPTETTTETTTTTEPLPETAPPPPAWKEAYASVVRSSGSDRFSLVYVDNNDVPELVLHEGDIEAHAQKNVTLYTYCYGRSIYLGTFCDDGYSNFTYNEREGYVFASYMGQGRGSDSYYILIDGEMFPLWERSCDTSGTHPAGNMYEINGVSCTEEEYDELPFVYDSVNRRTEQGMYEVNESNIWSFILG